MYFYNSIAVRVKYDKQEWGIYYGNFIDSFGHCWAIEAPLNNDIKSKKRTLKEAEIDIDDSTNNKPPTKKQKLNDVQKN